MKITMLLAAFLYVVLSGSNAGAATSAPYQKYLNGSCPSSDCVIDFPVVPAGRRLEITSASCYLRAGASPYSRLEELLLLVKLPGGSTALAVTLPTEQTSDAEDYRHFTADADIFAFATGGQHFQALAQLSRGDFRQFACHISGQLITP